MIHSPVGDGPCFQDRQHTLEMLFDCNILFEHHRLGSKSMAWRTRTGNNSHSSAVFSHCEIVFDSPFPFGVKAANKRVIKAGGMSESAVLKWGLKQPKAIEYWDERFHVLEQYRLFQGMRDGFSLKERYGLFLSDLLKVMSLVHVRVR
jgi:hypothetical protein